MDKQLSEILQNTLSGDRHSCISGHEECTAQLKDLITSLLRDCVSETWGAKDFSHAQALFDEFLKKRNNP